MRLFAKLAAIAASLFVCVGAAQAAVSIRIDLSTQRMHVSNSKGEQYTWAISSGRAGYNTPRGVYRPTMLRRMHYSSKYNNSPMPHSIFFRGGYAIHGTSYVRMLGRPASHGCIRLAPANAAKLFSMVQREGAVISIVGTPPHQRTAGAAAVHGGSVRAAKNGARSVAIAGRRATAGPLAYAPVQRPVAPTLRQFQANPARR